MDFIKKAQENPVLVSVGAVLAGLALLAGAAAFFSVDKSAWQLMVETVSYVFSTGAVVGVLFAVGLLLSFAASVAVVLGSVRNRKLAQQVSGELQSRTAERDALKSLVATMAEQAAEVGKELQETKHSIAIDSMRRYSSMKFGDKKPQVTIRCVGYGADYDLAERIKKTLREHANWEAQIDTTNKPSLPRADKFKVMFESGFHQAFDQLAYDFSQSELLGVTVGKRMADRDDGHHLIIFVFPEKET